MKILRFKFAPLVVAINSALFMSVAANADESKLSKESIVPTTTLPTITVVAKTEEDSYTVHETSSATGLEVTAQQTPKTITVITKQRIKDQQLETVKDVVKATPGINVQQLDGSRAEFFGRGFKIDDFNVDGLRVSYATKWGEGAELSTAAIYDRVDVVKGANGLMVGSGNPSATIDFTRKHADEADFSGKVSASHDKFGTYGATVDVGSKLTQSGRLRGRAIIDYTDGDTYIDREEKSNKTVYAVVDADVTDNTTASIGGMHQEKIQDQVMWGGLPIFYTDGSKIDWDTNHSTAVDWGKRDGITDEVFAAIDHNFGEDWQLAVNANHAKTDGDMKLFYANGFVYQPNGLLIGAINPTTGAPIPAVPTTYIWQTDTTDTNVSTDLTGSFEALGRQHQVMIGADYNDYKTTTTASDGTSTQPVIGIMDNWNNAYPEPTWGDAYQPEDYSIKEYGIYGSSRLQLSETLGLVLGSRVSNYNKQGKIYSTKLDVEHKDVWTPFVGLTYDINDNSTVFASYTDIFNPQDRRDVEGNYLEPIIGKNYEVGFKASNDADNLQAQFSVFNIEQDNLAQKDVGKAVKGVPIEQAYYASKGATSTGIDVEVTGRLSDNLQASIGYTQFDAKDANDKDVNTESPDTLIKLFTTYNMSDFVPGLSVGGGVNWMSERYTLFANPLKGGATEKVSENPVTLVNLMARYEVSDNLDLQVNVDNVLDEQYIQSFGFKQITLAEPMNITGRITYYW